MILCIHHSHVVTWSPRWKHKSGSSEAVARRAVAVCDAEVGQREPHLIWEHPTDRPDISWFHPWEYDKARCIFYFTSTRNFIWRFKMRISWLYLCVFLVVSEEPEEGQRRRRWVRDPPERILSLLEKAQLSRASSTFIINRGGQTMCGWMSCSVVHSH